MSVETGLWKKSPASLEEVRRQVRQMAIWQIVLGAAMVLGSPFVQGPPVLVRLLQCAWVFSLAGLYRYLRPDRMAESIFRRIELRQQRESDRIRIIHAGPR
jgi:hypothetical protein